MSVWLGAMQPSCHASGSAELLTPRTMTPTPSNNELQPSKTVGTTGSWSTLHGSEGGPHLLSTSMLPGPMGSSFSKRLGLGSSCRPRSFSSRHVPSIAEEIVISDVLNPSRAMRLNGLMKHLKRNSAWEDHQKQVLLAEAADTLVPEEYDEIIRSEFERRCAFGERMNTEFMSSAKWVKLLRDIGVLLPPGKSSSDKPAILQAEADIIFHKVLHNCDHGGQRLTYELFCKALYLAAQAILPDFQGEAAFGEILAQIISVAPEQISCIGGRGAGDPMLDARVLLVLDHFKPALHDLFRTFCGRNLSNPAWASPGSGIRRARDRSTIKHTQETFASGTLTGSCSIPPIPGFEANSPSASPTVTTRRLDGSESRSRSVKELPASWEVAARDLSEDFSDIGSGAGVGSAGGLSASGSCTPGGQSPSIATRSILSSPRTSPGTAQTTDRITPHFYLDSQGSSPAGNVFNQSMFASSVASGSPRVDTRQETANGSPVIQNRRQNMSVDQFLEWCKELNMMNTVLTRVEVVKIFKRAQTTGFPGSHGSGVHGFLSREAFVDAVGQLALEAYSKEPFCDEYVDAHEKICAFLLDYLPGSSREAQDRFLLGCSPRR